MFATFLPSCNTMVVVKYQFYGSQVFSLVSTVHDPLCRPLRTVQRAMCRYHSRLWCYIFVPRGMTFCEETTDSSAEPVISLVQGFQMKIQCQYGNLIIKIISWFYLVHQLSCWSYLSRAIIIIAKCNHCKLEELYCMATDGWNHGLKRQSHRHDARPAY